MNTFFSRLITVVACFFIFSAAWFCLWSISLHLVERPELAALLFPFGLRLGLRMTAAACRRALTSRASA